MNMETFIYSNSQPSFLNLSLLICRLFVGGDFKTVNFLYYQELFDDRFYSQIKSVCSHEIPITTTDISSLETLSNNQNEHDPGQTNKNDHILQLIFLPHEQLSKYFHRIEGLLKFYRVFVFLTINGMDFETSVMESAKVIANANTSSLLLIHNTSSDKTKPFILSRYLNNSMELIHVQNKSEKDLFNFALGEKEYERTLSIYYLDKIDCPASNPALQKPLLNQEAMIGKLYFNLFEISVVNAFSIICNESKRYFQQKRILPILTSGNYSEFYTKYKLFPNKYEFNYHTDSLGHVFNFYICCRNMKNLINIFSGKEYLENSNGSTKNKFPTNVRVTFNLKVFFVYSSGFTTHYSVFHSWSGYDILFMNIPIFIAAIILYVLRRRRAELQNINFWSGFLDMYVVVFGGGNIRVRHRWERMFFAIGLIASFFLISLYLADFSMHSILNENPNKIDTFEKLSKQNVTFYLTTNLIKHEAVIKGMLR